MFKNFVFILITLLLAWPSAFALAAGGNKYSVDVIYKEHGTAANLSRVYTVEANSDAQAKVEAVNKFDSETKNRIGNKIEKVIETRIRAKF